MRAWKVLLFLLFLVSGINLFGQPLPKRSNPHRLVNDYTGILTQDKREALERKLVEFDDSSSNQIAVIIIQSTNGEDPGDYATRIGREWGVGNKQFNNGVVLLIAKDDRKVFMLLATDWNLRYLTSPVNRLSKPKLFPISSRTIFIVVLTKAPMPLYKQQRGNTSPRWLCRSRKKRWRIRFLFIIVIVIIVIISLILIGEAVRIVHEQARFRIMVAPYRRMGRRKQWWRLGRGGSSGGGGFGGFGGGGFGGGGSGGSW